MGAKLGGVMRGLGLDLGAKIEEYGLSTFEGNASNGKAGFDSVLTALFGQAKERKEARD